MTQPFYQMKQKFLREVLRRVPALGILLSAAFLGGCAGGQVYKLEEAPEMAVAKDFTPFYSMGPQQMQGPDASLRLEERVKLLRKEFGYSYVQLEDGRSGFVPSDGLTAAPPRPVFTESAGTGGGGGGGRSFTPYSGPPVDDIPLPDLEFAPGDIPPPVLLDETEPEKKPQFRL